MYNKAFLVLIICTLLASCNKNDGDEIPRQQQRDRAEVQHESDSLILRYLTTHFYNYEEFASPPEAFDYKIVFDTIADENSAKIPLIDQVESQLINEQGQQEKLYFLKVREGAGASCTSTSNVILNYKGMHLKGGTFDSSDKPINLNLSIAISGFSNAVAKFRGASTFTQSANGESTFSNDYGIGAAFIPTGLAYYNFAAGPIVPYENLIFTFDLLQVPPN